MPNNSNSVVVRFIADTSSLLAGIAKADNALGLMSENMAKRVGGMATIMKTAGAVIGGALAVAVTNGTNDAIKFEAIMDGLSEQMGNSANSFTKWQEEVGSAMGYSKLAGAELAQQLSVNMKQISKDQEDMVNKTTKLMEASAIIRAKRGLQQEEVSRRIMSAMNQEQDGAAELGLNVKVSAITASNAFKMMADGKPWEELSGNMQKAILYQMILEQTASNFGTTMGSNTSVQLAGLTARLGDMKLAMGQAFLPIVSVAIPLLNRLIATLTKAFNVFAKFTAGLFGYKHDPAKTTKGMVAQAEATRQQNKEAQALAKTKDKLAKQDKAGAKSKKDGGFLASFDEVHTIPKKDSGAGAGSSGGAGGGGIGSALDDAGGMVKEEGGLIEKALEGVAKKAEELGKKLRKFLAPAVETFKEVYTAVKEYMMEKVKQVGKFWEENGDMIIEAWQNVWAVLKPIFTFIVKMIWNDLKHAIDGLIGFFLGLIKFLAGVFTGDFHAIWEGLKEMFLGALEAIFGIVNLLFIGKILGLFKTGGASLLKFFTEFWTTVRTLWDDALKGLQKFWDNLVYEIQFKMLQLKEFFLTWARGAFDNIVNVFKTIGKWFLDNVITPVINYFNTLKSNIGTAMTNAWNGIVNVFKGAWSWFSSNVVNPVVNGFNWMKDQIASKASQAWEAIKSPFYGAYNWVKTNVVDKIANAFSSIGGRVSDFFGGSVKGVINSGIDRINGLIGKINGVGSKLASFIPKWTWKDIGNIPKLANGGITNGPTLAMVGDNVGGQEVVSPLDRLQSMLTNSVLQAMQFGGGGNSGGGKGDIILNIDGRSFARIIQPYQNLEQNRVGSNLRLNTI